jgi:hypothetical protein
LTLAAVSKPNSWFLALEGNCVQQRSFSGSSPETHLTFRRAVRESKLLAWALNSYRTLQGRAEDISHKGSFAPSCKNNMTASISISISIFNNPTAAGWRRVWRAISLFCAVYG